MIRDANSAAVMRAGRSAQSGVETWFRRSSRLIVTGMEDAMSDTTHTLHTTHHNLIPSDRVEGTTVYGRDGQKLGIIERLMLEKATGNVAYAVIRHSGFLFSNTHHYPVLWGALKFNVQDCVYEADLTLAEMQAGLSEMDGDAFDWGNRAPPYAPPLYWGM